MSRNFQLFVINVKLFLVLCWPKLAKEKGKYKDNEKDEKPMQEYAESLGYRFTAAWAYLMPVEKMLAIDDPIKAQVVLVARLNTTGQGLAEQHRS